MNTEMNKRYFKAEEELNKVYNEILEDYKDDSTFIDKLKISQRIWIKFRDSEFEMKFPESEKQFHYGSVFPMCASHYLESLTLERLEKLNDWIEPAPEGDICNGSIMYRETDEDKIKFRVIDEGQSYFSLNNMVILKEIETSSYFIRVIGSGYLPRKSELKETELINELYISVTEFIESPKTTTFLLDDIYKPSILTSNSSDLDSPVVELEFSKNYKRHKTKISISQDEVKILEDLILEEK